MFETVLERRGRMRRALREFLDLSAGRVFTVRQQIAAALLLAALGAAGALVLAGWHARHFPAPVVVLPPVIERFEPDFSVYRIPFEHRGVEVWCHIVIYGERGTWTVHC